MSERNAGNQFNVLVGAATVYGDQFLLLKRSAREKFLPERWGIPAGKVDPSEDPQQACERELLEETGLQGEVVGIIGYSQFSSKRGRSQLSNVQLNFLIEVKDNAVQLDSKSHSMFEWIPLGDIENELLDSFTREIMESAVARRKMLGDSRLAPV